MNSKIIYIFNYIDSLLFRMVPFHESANYIFALLHHVRRYPGFISLRLGGFLFSFALFFVFFVKCRL